MTRALLVGLVCLVCAAPADAHTLTMRGARHMADRYVQRVAASASPVVVRATVRGCERRTRHRVDCTARFRFGSVACDRVVRVRFTSEHTRRVSTRFVGDVECR